MHDVFVSYSRDDRATAQRFAQGFEREGFGVSWDQAIVAGEAFDRATERALREARAVVVLWSKRSAESERVRAEAAGTRSTDHPSASRPRRAMAYRADAPGDADSAASILRATWASPGPNACSRNEARWTAPHSALRSSVGFRTLLRESGLVDHGRQTGEWADACRPPGDDDFECR